MCQRGNTGLKTEEPEATKQFVDSGSSGTGGLSAAAPTVAGGAGQEGGSRIVVQLLLLHLLMDDGMPILRAFLRRNIVFPSPTPQTQLLDEIQLQYATAHTQTP